MLLFASCGFCILPLILAETRARKFSTLEKARRMRGPVLEGFPRCKKIDESELIFETSALTQS
jgi:hypothetical protein